jgi:glucose-1-phosphate cytidylyltransferase
MNSEGVAILKAVILAGGLGTRLGEITDSIPKPMVEIGGRPIIWHIMKMYGHHGITDFIICLGYRSYVVKEYFSNYFLHMNDITFNMADNSMEVHNNTAEPWRVTLVDTGMSTMTGGRLRRIQPYLNDETFCMTYGDGVSDIDITKSVEFHRTHGRLVTVTAVNQPGRFGVLHSEGDVVKEVREKVVSSESLINGGFFVIEPAALSYIDDDETTWEQVPLRNLAKDGQLRQFHHSGFWQPMDTIREKAMLEELWQSGSPPWRTWP